jgi:hypothetical protein
MQTKKKRRRKQQHPLAKERFDKIVQLLRLRAKHGGKAPKTVPPKKP